MITPKNINNILNKLPEKKVELEKVELSSAKELQKALKDIKVLVKESVKVYNKMEKLYEQTKSMRERLEAESRKGEGLSNGLFDLVDSGKALLSKIESAAKELGVDPNDITGYKEFKDVRAQAHFDAKNVGSGEYMLQELGG